MPLPPPLLPLLTPHTITTATYAAQTISSSLLAAVLARDLYQRTPDWMRRDESWNSLLSNSDEGKGEGGEHGGGSGGGHRDEMASLAAIIQKLQGLIGVGYDTLGSERRRRRRRRTAAGWKRDRFKKSGSDCLCGGCDVCSSCRDDERGSFESSVTSESLSDSITPLEWHAALLAYIQLSNQMRERYPSWRDGMYEIDSSEDEKLESAEINADCNENLDQQEDTTNCKSALQQEYEDKSPTNSTPRNANRSTETITMSEIQELKQMLDYAVWAYEPDEEVLRNLLKSDDHTGTAKDAKDSDETNQGYQLLVHRTTSYIEPNETNQSTTNKSSKGKKLRKPPGRVGYYVAISHSQKTLLIGMKGTSTLEDILTDCCGRAMRLDLENDPHHPLVGLGCNETSEESSECQVDVNEVVDEIIRDEVNNNELTTEDGSDYVKDETVQVSMVSSSGQCKMDEIEVNLVEVDLFHRDESIETSIAPKQSTTINEADVNESTETTAMLKQPESPKRKSSGVNLSTLSAPLPAENVLLVPTAPVDTTTKDNNKTNTLATTITEQISSRELGIEMQPQRSTKARGVHEGLVHCARQLFSEISPLIEEYASKGYDVVCTGHSMGAGTSALLALLIRGRFPELVVPRETSDKDTETIERVRVYAFAPPPVMDRESALACQHYVTSIVNNSDIIPRSSLTNLDVLLTMLEAVRKRLQDHGMNISGTPSKSGKPKGILSSMLALYRKLSQGTGGDLLIDPVELRQVWDEAVADASLGEEEIYWDDTGNHHLFVPGNVLMLYEPWSVADTSNEQHPEQEDSTVPCADKVDGKGQAEQTEADLSLNYRTLWTDGTAPMLKGFEVGAGGYIVTDHLTSSYYRALNSLENALTSAASAMSTDS